jgi:hypothetical protein
MTINPNELLTVATQIFLLRRVYENMRGNQTQAAAAADLLVIIEDGERRFLAAVNAPALTFTATSK